MFFRINKWLDEVKEPWRFFLVLVLLSVGFFLFLGHEEKNFQIIGLIYLVLFGTGRMVWAFMRLIWIDHSVAKNPT